MSTKAMKVDSSIFTTDAGRLIPDATYCLLQLWSKSEKGKSRGTSVFCIVGSVP